uniref:Uncharacterized protein n=1 Tax=Amphora coffeiformis TaxID=265554 RepID=A0A7S3L8L8_9STRA
MVDNEARTRRPTTAPTTPPPDGSYYDDYYGDFWSRGDAPSESPSLINNACRCDGEGTCLSTPLPTGVNLTLCIFTPDSSFSFVGVTSLSLSQGNVVLDILATDETPVTQSCLGDSCVLEIALDDSLYGSNNQDSATIMGVAALEHEGRRQLAVRAEMDFSAEIPLDTATTDIVGDDVNGNDGNRGDNVTDNGTGSRKVVWLFPLLAVLFVAFVCIVVVVRKRNEQQQQASRAGSRTSSV